MCCHLHSSHAEQTGGGGGGGGHAARLQHPAGVAPRPAVPTGGAGGAVDAYAPAGGPLPLPLQLLSAVLGAPFALLGGSVRLVGRVLGMGASVAGAVGRRVLPARLVAALGRAGRAVAAAGAEVAPAAAAEEFVRQFAGGSCD